MLLVIFLIGAILWILPHSRYDNILFVSAVKPGYLDFDNLPDTNFSCERKVIGGYYADIETGCQMFHVCTLGQKAEITDIKFLCLNGTVFDQETRVCERLDEVDCSKSESYFDLNLELYGNNGGGYGIQPEDETRSGDPEQVNCEEEYDDADVVCKKEVPEQQKNHMTNIRAELEYADWEEEATIPSTVSISKLPSIKLSTSTVKPSLTVPLRSTSVSSPPQFHFHPSKSIAISTTTPNTIAQLLALHEAFQENLKQRDSSTRFRPNKIEHEKNTTILNFPKIPLPYSSYQISTNTQIKPMPFSAPNELPNSFSNLSQKIHFSNSLLNNRNFSPDSEAFKPETLILYNNKRNDQKITNKSAPVNFTPSHKTTQKHVNIDTPVLYAYKILNTEAVKSDHFIPNNVNRNSQSFDKITIPTETFKMEPISNPITRASYTITQNRPYIFHPETSNLLRTNKNDGVLDVDEGVETVDNSVLLEKQRKSQQKFNNLLSHSNFARAIADRNTPKNISDPSISVVLSTSSVSSSISLKPKSAILNKVNAFSVLSPTQSKNSFSDNNNHNNNNNNSSNTFSSNPQNKPLRGMETYQVNITDINESFPQTSEPYYEELGADYDENSEDYKDLLYRTDVKKIKQ